MANDLNVIPRQFAPQNVDLGGTHAFSRIQSALTDLSDYAAGKASDLFAEDAAAKGKQLALSQQGNPQELKPGVNKATAAFNNAYNEMTAGLLSVRLNELIVNNLNTKSDPKTLGPRSIADLNALNNSTWLGFQSEIPKNMQADMEYAYIQANAKSLEIMGNTVSSFNAANIKKDVDVVGKSSKAKYAATILSGDKKQEKEALDGVLKWLDNAAQLSGMTPIQKEDEIRQIQDIAIDAHVHRDMMEAAINGGEEGVAAYIIKVMNSTPEQLGVTPEQKQIISESALKYNTQIANQMNIGSTQGYNNIVLEAVNNPGSITSLPQLNQKISEQAQKGFPLTQAQQIQLNAKILGKNKEASKRAQTNAEINSSVSSGDIGIVNYTTGEINNYWEDVFKASVEQVKEMEANGTVQPGQIKPWQMEVQSAVNIQRDVPALTARIEARLTGPNTNNIQDGIRQYSFLKTNNPLALSGLSPKIDAFATTILEKAQNVTDPVTIERIIADAKEGVLNADQDVVDARVKAYRAFAIKNPNSVDKQIRGALGLKSGFLFSSSDPIPDFQRARYNRILETNVPLYETKDMQLAFKKTTEEFNNIYKKDPGFAPANMTVSNAISNLPWSKTTGPMNSNQVSQAISQIIDVNSKFPGKTGFTLEPSSKMPKFPSSVKETDKLGKQFAPNGHWMKINGVDRKIYLMSPNYSTTNPFAANAYQVYWGDTGADGKSKEAIRPLTSLITKKLPNGKEVTSMGPALVTIYPPNIYIPNLYKKQQNTAASTGFDTAAFASVDQANPIKLRDFFAGSISEDAALVNAAKIISKKNKIINKEAPTKSKEVKAKFEDERLVREELERIKREGGL